MEVQPAYYAILPPKIRYCNTISTEAKLVYAELSAIAYSLQAIIPTNDLYGHFEKYLKMSNDEVENALEELKVNCFLQFDLTFDGKCIITTKYK